MTGRPKRRPPIPFRPGTADDEKWLRDHAAATNRSVGAVIKEALRAYRDRLAAACDGS